MHGKKLSTEKSISDWAKIVVLKEIQMFLKSVFWVKFSQKIP